MINEIKGGNKKEYTVDVNYDEEIPSKVIEALKEFQKELTLIINNCTWKIKNGEIRQPETVNLGMTENPGKIPEELASALSEEYREIELEDSGEFGYTAYLSYNMGIENKGKNALLYYYNESENILEKQSSCKVSNQGYAEFPLTHASSYLVVIEAEIINDTEKIQEKEKEPEKHVEKKDKQMKEEKMQYVNYWLIGLLLLLILLFVLFLVLKRRWKQEEE